MYLVSIAIIFSQRKTILPRQFSSFTEYLTFYVFLDYFWVEWEFGLTSFTKYLEGACLYLEGMKTSLFCCTDRNITQYIYVIPKSVTLFRQQTNHSLNYPLYFIHNHKGAKIFLLHKHFI